MKILTPAQIRALDAYTIANEPIKSIDLMERAANAFVNWFTQQFPDAGRTPIYIFCGPGNNGGDGLAIARLLNRKFYQVVVYICAIGNQQSADFKKNLKRLPSRRGLPTFTLTEGTRLDSFESQAVIIDAMFGSGLNRPITGYWEKVIDHINQLSNSVVAVDIPSGLFANQHTPSIAIKADYTLSFELAKSAFFFPENHDKVGKTFIQPIGLNQSFIQQTPTTNYVITKPLVQSIVKTRQKFDHKGTYGHALLLVGSLGKMGAAVLATKACLRSGAGLVTTHTPKCGYTILQISCPEAMASIDKAADYISELPEIASYKAIGIGCGIDQKAATKSTLLGLLANSTQPLVVDADALNILAANSTELENIPPNSILTPHPKEFERLFGKTDNDFARNELQLTKAKELNCVILLKGGNTCIATPAGDCYFNTTGNPGMATGGSGDVLTGILTGLLAQGYTAKKATILGAYLHGLAGDLAAKTIGQESMIAGDLIDYIGKAFQQLNA